MILCISVFLQPCPVGSLSGSCYLWWFNGIILLSSILRQTSRIPNPRKFPSSFCMGFVQCFCFFFFFLVSYGCRVSECECEERVWRKLVGEVGWQSWFSQRIGANRSDGDRKGGTSKKSNGSAQTKMDSGGGGSSPGRSWKVWAREVESNTEGLQIWALSYIPI